MRMKLSSHHSVVVRLDCLCSIYTTKTMKLVILDDIASNFENDVVNFNWKTNEENLSGKSCNQTVVLTNLTVLVYLLRLRTDCDHLSDLLSNK